MNYFLLNVTYYNGFGSDKLVAALDLDDAIIIAKKYVDDYNKPLPKRKQIVEWSIEKALSYE